MERISIFNYEVFYLDYLEGNLSEEDTQMLMQFLEEHPECLMEEDAFVVLEDDETFTYTKKEQLKQTDEADTIVLQNVEHFMIADAEGLLTEEKQNELDGFIAGNAALEASKARYKAVYFQPDLTQVYTEKKALMRRNKLVLWPYISGAVAAAVVAFVLFTNAGNIQSVTIDFASDNLKLNVPTLGLTDVVEPVVPEIQPAPNNIVVAHGEPGVIRTKRISDAIDHEKLTTRPSSDFMKTSFDNQTLMPVTQIDPSKATLDNSIAREPAIPVNKTDQANNDMKNPIAPITNFINKKSDTDVDFGQRKASTDKKGGFYVKIGKFELSRNKH